LVEPVETTRSSRCFAQSCADEFALRRLGRISQAVIVLVWSIVALDIGWSPVR